MIDLFAHNQTAYDAAIALLEETGKAAIVHPTGTGKSFIGFKLCEERPTAKICWLSPSEYIFRTQLENLASAAEGYQPENIQFYTYAKLMVMEEEELQDIHPDYIVLDEFHRCGAEMWGQGVQKLLSLYPATPILGLSATNIRYLDNQRDMADELFDGNIASEMTLGEAIVRGILVAPKYVLSVFSYQKELEKYRKRVEKAQSPWVRDKATEYLEALKRALDKADGLDVVFEKHMTNRTGKYIVFCANFEHLKEMMDKSREWFKKVDSNPHVYSVYSYDPSASQSFADFKADNDDTHLRLLYCIDALNEGIHMDDISGVILLRPTVSPIIYKQQIGRAMSAGKSGETVIFDIVANISGLYSIDSIQDEMNTAMEYYRYMGEEKKIVNERFRVFDEVQNCKKLFDQLEHTMIASWEQMFGIAKAYFEEHGNLLPPVSYTTEEGYHLGQWVVAQRASYNRRDSSLTAERIAMLESIGMSWLTQMAEELHQMPEQLMLYQRQVQRFFDLVLDVDKAGREPQQQIRRCFTYGIPDHPSDPDMFPFRPISVSIEPTDEGTCVPVLYAKHIPDIIDFSLRSCVERNITVRRCKNCGRYFAQTGRVSAEYCDRPVPRGQQKCREIGAFQQWTLKQSDDPVFKAYRREYKRRFAWIKAGRISDSQFYAWSEQAREQKKKCDRDIISLEEFRQWLKES